MKMKIKNNIFLNYKIKPIKKITVQMIYIIILNNHHHSNNKLS